MMSQRPTRRWTAIASTALVAVVAVLTAGCFGASGTDKAGGAGSPVRLQLATSAQAGSAEARAIEHFRDELAKLSDGAVRVEPVYEAAGHAPRYDQVVADLVRSGRVELAVVPSRAWDAYGVRSLQALQAPFLIQDQATLDDVTSGELVTPMLRGLRAIGVEGLALLPQGFRHPFGFARPLRSPRDFAGATIRAPHSEATYALLRALGAQPTDFSGDELRRAIRDGRLAGAESAFDLAAPTLHGSLPTATGNITFFPNVDVLVAGSTVLDELPKSTRNAIDTAAARTRDWARNAERDEHAAALDYCREGGRVVAANAADVRRLAAMAAPVYASLERDPTTRRLIAAIRDHASDRGGAAPTAVTCEPANGSIEPQDAPKRTDTDQRLLDGIYRNRTTVADFTRRDVNESTARHIYGLHTITLSNGRLHDRLIAAENPTSDVPCDGKYRLDGHTFTFAWNADTPCTGDITATWELSDGALRFKDVQARDRGDEIYWGLRSFRRLG